MTNTETFDEQNPYLHGDFPTFHKYLDEQEDWVKASNDRDESRKAWRERSLPTGKMLKASYFAQAAEMLSDRTVMHYQGCMTNEEADIIQNWTGTNPEISVEYFQEVVEHLQEMSLKLSKEAIDYQTKTKQLEAEHNKRQAVVSELFDKYRVKYNELKKANEEDNN